MNNQDMKAVNALRVLSSDMIHRAKSGHPGIALDAAPMMYTLYEKMMNINPEDPRWLNRDRFVLSSGHASSLLYSVLYFNHFGLTIQDLKDFRQLGSKTPGHPEYGVTAGVDATTGPLSQGIGMAVGMAMAEKHLAALYNKPGYQVIDHYTYTLLGDGDLMEGLSEEAINIAGQHQLNKLIVLYDSNDVSLDGPLSYSTHENVRQRFEAANWDYQIVKDGNHDLQAIQDALQNAQRSDKPSLIEVKTTIGIGTKEAGTNKIHGAALTDDQIVQLRQYYDWQLPPFVFPNDVYETFDRAVDSKRSRYTQWQKMMDEYQKAYPNEFRELFSIHLDTEGLKTKYHSGDQVATRNVCAEMLEELSQLNPQLWTGAADLSSSTKTNLKNTDRFSADHPAGRNVYFGVREFGMAAAINGMNLHGGNKAICSTFFTFTDYMRSAIRSAALMHLPSVFVGSHDSVAVGEDGPTHEPIEQLASYRAMPNLNVIRPTDANEMVASWQVIANTVDRPTLLVTSRQKLPVMDETVGALVDRGGYILRDAKAGMPDLILMASGSEVHLAMEVQKRLAKLGYQARVVSMPCMDLFKEQPVGYRDSVLPPEVTNRVAIEMGASQSWYEFVGLDGQVFGIDRFGASGKGESVIDHFGFTADQIMQKLNLAKEKVNN
ncbi:transketolase [uncultured Limosilactobacillus sp.]|uniref:transketolase n=1 Tax=uncultured Limosilactobacillus sp. TaxID=2837629 RepID=UPI0025DC3F36|nr:transketolase [uncultured Limosilactobacillus sp.]